MSSGSAETVEFHARVVRPGEQFAPGIGLSREKNGRLIVTASEVEWRPADGEGWTRPVSTVTVLATHTTFLVTGTGVDLQIDGAGSWRVVVSDRPINWFVKNSTRNFRTSGAARRLSDLLLSRGARKG